MKSLFQNLQKRELAESFDSDVFEYLQNSGKSEKMPHMEGQFETKPLTDIVCTLSSRASPITLFCHVC